MSVPHEILNWCYTQLQPLKPQSGSRPARPRTWLGTCTSMPQELGLQTSVLAVESETALGFHSSQSQSQSRASAAHPGTQLMNRQQPS